MKRKNAILVTLLTSSLLIGGGALVACDDTEEETGEIGDGEIEGGTNEGSETGEGSESGSGESGEGEGSESGEGSGEGEESGSEEGGSESGEESGSEEGSEPGTGESGEGEGSEEGSESGETEEGSESEELEVTNIADIKSEGTYKVQGWVVAKDNYDVVIRDETGGVLLYGKSLVSRLNVGDYISVEGEVSSYKDLYDFDCNAEIEVIETSETYTEEEATPLDVDEFNELLNSSIDQSNVIKYSWTATLGTISSYRNFTADGVSYTMESNYGGIYDEIGNALTDGETYDFEGYFVGKQISGNFSNAFFVITSATEVEEEGSETEGGTSEGTETGEGEEGSETEEGIEWSEINNEGLDQTSSLTTYLGNFGHFRVLNDISNLLSKGLTSGTSLTLEAKDSENNIITYDDPQSIALSSDVVLDSNGVDTYTLELDLALDHYGYNNKSRGLTATGNVSLLFEGTMSANEETTTFEATSFTFNSEEGLTFNVADTESFSDVESGLTVIFNDVTGTFETTSGKASAVEFVFDESSSSASISDTNTPKFTLSDGALIYDGLLFDVGNIVNLIDANESGELN